MNFYDHPQTLLEDRGSFVRELEFLIDDEADAFFVNLL